MWLSIFSGSVLAEGWSFSDFLAAMPDLAPSFAIASTGALIKTPLCKA